MFHAEKKAFNFPGINTIENQETEDVTRMVSNEMIFKKYLKNSMLVDKEVQVRDCDFHNSSTHNTSLFEE